LRGERGDGYGRIGMDGWLGMDGMDE